MSTENQKPQMQVMAAIQNTPPFQIAVLDFVKDKFVRNYNVTHALPAEDKMGELVYQRQLVFFQNQIAGSDQLQKADPFSIYACLLTVAVKNYSLDPEDQEVYLYPRAGKAVLQRQAGAHVRRLMETRQIRKALPAKLVYKGDDFEVEEGRVVKHKEKFLSEEIIAGYVKFEMPTGSESHFIYRKSDWEAWKKKSPQSGGDNWTGNAGQPIAAFLRTKLIKHAATEKCWASGSTSPLAETYTDVEVDDDEPANNLPAINERASYQPAMVVTPAGDMNNFDQPDPPAGNGIVYEEKEEWDFAN